MAVRRLIQNQRWLIYVAVAAFCFLFLCGPETQAIVFKRPDEALKGVFKDARIVVKNIVLKSEQVSDIEKLSGIKQEDRLVSFYEAKRDNEVIGYAFIDSHIVRTKIETVLYVINPSGKIETIEVLSFNEPLDYLPNENWLRLFTGRSVDKDEIRLRRDIPAITGATLTSKAITDNTRKVLAIWKVVFGGKR